MDDCNYTVMSTDAHKNGTLITQSKFLHNKKVSTSAFNEAKSKEKDKNKNKPKGRVLSLTEMIQMLLLYDKVQTDIFLIHIQTTPLELRARTEKLNKSSNIGDNGTTLEIESQHVGADTYFLYGDYTAIPNVWFS